MYTHKVPRNCSGVKKSKGSSHVFSAKNFWLFLNFQKTPKIETSKKSQNFLDEKTHELPFDFFTPEQFLGTLWVGVHGRYFPDRSKRCCLKADSHLFPAIFMGRGWDFFYPKMDPPLARPPPVAGDVHPPIDLEHGVRSQTPDPRPPPAAPTHENRRG